MKLLDESGLAYLIQRIKTMLNGKADKSEVKKIITSAVEPTLKTNDEWHREV